MTVYLTPFRLSSPQFLQASGILKGFDPLLNLVLDGTIEYMRGECSQRGSEPPHWALLTAQARQPATCAMRTVLADQTAADMLRFPLPWCSWHARWTIVSGT